MADVRGAVALRRTNSDMPTLRHMSIMLQVIITLGWSMLLALEFFDDNQLWTERWIIGTAVLIVMAIAALAFWWRWEREIK